MLRTCSKSFGSPTDPGRLKLSPTTAASGAHALHGSMHSVGYLVSPIPALGEESTERAGRWSRCPYPEDHPAFFNEDSTPGIGEQLTTEAPPES